MGYSRQNKTRHISELLQVLPGVRIAAWVDGGSPNKRLGERHKRGSVKVAPYPKKMHGGVQNKTPNGDTKTKVLMKVTSHEDLFGEVHLQLESIYLEDAIRGAGYNHPEARSALQEAIVCEMRSTLKKTISVYEYSKYQFDFMRGREVLPRLQNAVKSINRRTSLEKAQKVIEEIWNDLDFVLPTDSARSYPSQLRKISLLQAFADTNFNTIIDTKTKQYDL